MQDIQQEIAKAIRENEHDKMKRKVEIADRMEKEFLKFIIILFIVFIITFTLTYFITLNK